MRGYEENLLGKNFAARSPLYSMEPMGVGTAVVESLTSYVARLAQAHGVSTATLVNRVLVPALNKAYLSRAAERGGSRFYDRSSSLNGTGSTAYEVAEVLNLLTGRTDLTKLTLLTWDKLVSSRDLQRTRTAWCPTCLEHFLSEGDTVYEPLLWSLQSVRICPVHGDELVEVCKHCNRTSPLLTRRSRTGHCSRCHGWLGGESKGHKQITPFQEFSLTETKQLVQICQYQQLDLDMPSVLNNLMSNAPGMNLASCARQIGFPKVTLWDWAKRDVKPSFNNLLEFCYRLNISVIRLIEQRWASEQIKITAGLGVKIKLRKNSRFIDWDHVRQELEDILSDPNGIVSMAEVARKIGNAKRDLYRHYPDQCKAIARRYMNQVNKLRNGKIELIRSEVRTIGEHLLSSGQYPSRRQIEALSSKPAILRSHDAKREWISLLQKSFPSDNGHGH